MNIQKYGRNYRLTIDPKDGQPPIVVQPPFTCRFWVNRDALSSVNTASIDVYNLSVGNRRRIFQDRFDLAPVVVNNVSLGARTVKFEAGYGNNLYTLFEGSLQIASSAREGTNIVTRLETLAGLFDLANSTVNFTMPAGTTLYQVFKYLAGQMPTLQIGYISNFTQQFTSPVVLNGKPWDLMVQYAQSYQNGSYIDLFTDNGKVYVMASNDKLTSGGPIPVLDASTGLLETPRREQAFISIVTLLQTSIQVNSVVQVNSLVEPSYNGQYAVIGLQHSGIISPAVGGDCRSVFYLLKPERAKYNLVQSQ